MAKTSMPAAALQCARGSSAPNREWISSTTPSVLYPAGECPPRFSRSLGGRHLPIAGNQNRARYVAQPSRIDFISKSLLAERANDCAVSGIKMSVQKYVIPVYKKGVHTRGFVRPSRLRTDDLFHLPPRADLIPRRFSSIAIEASESAPLARIAWIAGSRPEANSSATSISAALPMLPA
jgi:hypothetical protein